LSQPAAVRIVELVDEQEVGATAALDLIENTFERRDRQPVEELRSEIAERRLRLTTAQEFHLLAALDDESGVIAAVTGVYLDGINAGFVTYLAVRDDRRRHGIGRRLRAGLVERFRVDARLAGFDELAWVLGEVRLSSPWLKRLVRKRSVVPFDITYYHPGVRPPDRPLHALYRQPVGDSGEVVSADLVRRLLYAIYRRAYRVRYPLLHPGFLAMMDQLEGIERVGMHPRFAKLIRPADEEGAGPAEPAPS